MLSGNTLKTNSTRYTWVQSIFDNKIMYAANVQAPNKTIVKVLTRSREHNLTLNLQKCKFNKTELNPVSMGRILSKDRIKTDQTEVKAI